MIMITITITITITISIMITIIIIITITIRIIAIIIMTKRFPAHDELGTCGTSLVFPMQSVLRIFKQRCF